MNEPKVVKVQAKEVTMPNITQYYLEVQEKRKFDILTRLLDMQSPELAIIFGRTKRRVDELSEALNMRGYSAQGIHGDLTQSKRLSVLRQFKEGSIDVLVATDVAARGLDISGVTHVYNFDIPQDPESYVHRIGRTGRAGKMGAAMTFVTPRETGQLHNIERTTKRKMERLTPPTLDEAMEGQQRIAADKLTESVTQGNLSYYKQLAEELLEEHDSVSLVAAAIKLFTKEPNESPIQLTAEPPVIAKGDKNKRGNGGGRSRSNSKNYSQQNRRGNSKRFGDKRRGGSNGSDNRNRNSSSNRKDSRSKA
jgi:ATP-dependent RNA helicase DeaD